MPLGGSQLADTIAKSDRRAASADEEATAFEQKAAMVTPDPRVGVFT